MKTGFGANGLSFNPRTPAGCDVVLHGTLSHVELFQSTHPCGVRQLVQALIDFIF